MKKMKLSLDTLQVESFVTAVEGGVMSGRGTVRGRQPGVYTGAHYNGICWATKYEPFSCQQTCPAVDYTCGSTCANTCRESCPATCPVSCHGCMTGGCGNTTVNTGGGDSAAADCMGGPGNTM